MTTRRRVGPFNNAIPARECHQLRSLMVFPFSKPSSHSWTHGSFPGGKPPPSSMLFANLPVFPAPGSPYVGAMATGPTYTHMVVPTQMSAPFQTVVQQQPSPVIQVLPPPVIHYSPPPVVVAAPPTCTVVQTSPLPPPPPPLPAPHVPSPVIPSTPRVFQLVGNDHHSTPAPASMVFPAPLQHLAQQQQGSPGNVTLNFYMATPEHQSRQLHDGTPSPSPSPQPQHIWQHQLQSQSAQPPQPQLHHPTPMVPCQTPLTVNFNQLPPTR